MHTIYRYITTVHTTTTYKAKAIAMLALSDMFRYPYTYIYKSYTYTIYINRRDIHVFARRKLAAHFMFYKNENKPNVSALSLPRTKSRKRKRNRTFFFCFYLNWFSSFLDFWFICEQFSQARRRIIMMIVYIVILNKKSEFSTISEYTKYNSQAPSPYPLIFLSQSHLHKMLCRIFSL